jgi:DNA-binding HxlR family transcriptional regulator
MENENTQDQVVHTGEKCKGMLLPVQDALDVLSGKWKLPIIAALLFGTRRFRELSREINGITDRMLSKQLRELETNQLISRTVHDAYPPVVEYALTEHGQTLKRILEELQKWGTEHRRTIIGK